MTTSFLLILIGVVLIFVSSIAPSLPLGADRTLSLWNMGWGFVLAGALLAK